MAWRCSFSFFSTMTATRRVAVALSGGVDSSVTALLLKRAGYDIFGIHMTNWDERDEKAISVCSATQDLADAKQICAQLSIPFKHVSFEREYWNNVFVPSLEEYAKGHTPNPDVLCNKEIKFGVLLQHAMSLGATHLATGHYARVRPSLEKPGLVELLRGVDPVKDQSYFLSSVHQDALQRAMFPLGEYLKPEIRKIAAEANLCTASKRESMGLCFVGKRDFSSFLDNYIPKKEGVFRCFETGKILGKHSGVHNFTIGKGAAIGGLAAKHYVLYLDPETQEVIVCTTDHPALLSKTMIVKNTHWISGSPPLELSETGKFKCQIRIRHGPEIHSCLISFIGENSEGFIFEKDASSMRVVFDEPMKAIAPLQVAVFYDNEVCLGSALIQEREKTLEI